jgi:hypothetical protein
MNKFLDQYKYVSKVIDSCVTPEQLDNAKAWARDWSARMYRLYPKLVPSQEELYDAVTS